MAPVTLPPSFYNSFWSPDYRTGLDVLFKQLQQGCLEDDDIVEFITSQVNAHHALAKTLLDPPLSSTSSSSTSSLQHTLLSLRGASSARGEAHRALAIELDQRILAGFKVWKERHEDRIVSAKDEFLGKNGIIAGWEKEVQKLSGLKAAYTNKSRAADDSEDDAKFAPAPAHSPPSDSYTASPKLKNALLKRSGTVADRISEKLRQASISSTSSTKSHVSIDGKVLPAPPTPLRSSSPVQDEKAFVDSPSSPTREERFIPPTDPFSQPSVQRNGPPVPSKITSAEGKAEAPQPILLSGLAFTPNSLKELLKRFDTYLISTLAVGVEIDPDAYPTKSKAALASRQRSTILGTYEKTFSGEEFVEWLRTNVEGFGGDWDRCVDVATELYAGSHLGRAGVGRGYEPTAESHYVLKLEKPESPSTANNAPVTPSTSTSFSLLKHYLPSALGSSDEPAHVRLRKDAIKADEIYKDGVKVVEDKRLDMEERMERGLRIWEKWERERLGTVRAVLKQYEEALSRLPIRLSDLQPSTALSVEAFNPDADLKALIEGNRTGPFKPKPTIYESIETDVPEVNFGIDLRRWAGDQGWKASKSLNRPKGSVPEVLEGLLQGIEGMYQEIPEDERRKAWLYEVPLYETHALRHTINDPMLTAEEIALAVQKFNVPVAAGTVKLWLLELNPPIMGWEGWEDAKAIYPSVGADQERDMTSAVTSVLGRLPGAQLYVLDALVKHFRELIDHTKTEEANDVYITKLSLSLGRNILRPQQDTELTIGDRTPSLFLADLINLYQNIFPSLVEKKKKEADRVMPIRKRTVLVDQRISRSRLSRETNPHELLEAQHAMQNPKTKSLASPPSEAQGSDLPPSVPLHGGNALGLGDQIQSNDYDNDGPPRFQEPKDDDEISSSPQASINIQPPSPLPVTTATQSQTQRQAAASVPPSAPRDPDGPPSFVDPDSSDNEDSGSRTPIAGKRDDSATAAYLSSLEPAEEDQPVPGAPAGGAGGMTGGGSSSLKRAGSGEATRLRGPRGARGPRPAPGGARLPSGAAPTD